MFSTGCLYVTYLLVMAFTTAPVTSRSCRRLFRKRPSCCLLLDVEVARHNCQARSVDGSACLCHASCTLRGNCCPDFSAICPQPGNRLQAWCPSEGLDQLFINDLLREPEFAGKPAGKSSKQSLWEKRVSRGRLPWHLLSYDFRTRGQEPEPEMSAPNVNDPSLVGIAGHVDELELHKSQSENDQGARNATSEQPGTSRHRIHLRRQWPWSVIGRIVFNYVPKFARKSSSVIGSCTGSLIGPRHVLTAAHCLFNRPSQSWHALVQVFLPNKNTITEASQRPIGWAKMMIPYSYKVFGKREADYGLIILEDDFSESEGWLAFGARSPAKGPLQLVGYDYHAMWAHRSCSVSSGVKRPVVSHDCLATPGMSGSPLIGKAPPRQHAFLPNAVHDSHRATENVVYAIHTHSQGERRRRSRALEINLCLYHTLCGWLNFEENSSMLGRRTRSEIFRQSLGRQCSAMTDFVPSLIRRQ